MRLSSTYMGGTHQPGSTAIPLNPKFVMVRSTSWTAAGTSIPLTPAMDRGNLSGYWLRSSAMSSLETTRCPACLPTSIPLSTPAASISCRNRSTDFWTIDCGRSYPLTRGLRLTDGRAPGTGASTSLRLLNGGLTRASSIILSFSSQGIFSVDLHGNKVGSSCGRGYIGGDASVIIQRNDQVLAG